MGGGTRKHLAFVWVGHNTFGMYLGHIYAVDIRGGNRRKNSSVPLDHLLTSEAP